MRRAVTVQDLLPGNLRGDMSRLDHLINFFKNPDTGEAKPPVISVDDLPSGGRQAGSRFPYYQSNLTNNDGSKFFGGFGPTQLFVTDYWTLRARSVQLFTENLYARGLIRRLITNEINKGLNLEATPVGDVLGIDNEALNEWSEDVENRFSIWAENPAVCDYKQEHTFGELQQMARLEALISGDVLVVLRQHPKLKTPMVQLIPGSRVQTPVGKVPRKGHVIIHGVELDTRGRKVAYWVRKTNGTSEAEWGVGIVGESIASDGTISKRIPAFGERTGRRLAWLKYGTDKLLDKVRGEPLLSIVLQSLKEIDRYRDSEQRAAVINSVLAMFVKKDEDKVSTKPLTGGAVRRDSADLDNPDGTTREFNIAGQIPGLVLEELQQGETPVSFDTTRPNVNFGVFEAAVLHAVAWANEVPPGVLLLAFHSNYSASRGEVNELKMYLDKIRAGEANSLGKPVYINWLLSSVLLGQVKAEGLLEAWRNPLEYDIFGAWTASDWNGALKPNVDLKKEVQAYQLMVGEGFITRERAARELTGMKYSKNVKRLLLENEQLSEANEFLSIVEETPEGAPGTDVDGVAETIKEEVLEMIVDNTKEVINQ